MHRCVRYALIGTFIALLIPFPAFAGTTQTQGGGVTIWEAFFMLLTVVPVSKMFSQIFMKLVVRQGVVNEEGLAGLGMGALGGLGGFLMLGQAASRSLGGKGLPSSNKGNNANLLGGFSPGGGYSRRGGSGRGGSRGSDGSGSSDYSPGGSSGSSPAGGSGDAPGAAGSGGSPPGSSGRVSGARPTEGPSSGTDWGSSMSGGPDPSVFGRGPFTATPVDDPGGDSGSFDSSGGSYDEPDYRYQPGASSPLERQPGDPLSFDEILAGADHSSAKAARVAGGMGGLGSMAVPGVMPLVSGIAAGASKAFTNGAFTLGRTSVDFIKQMQLHKNNVGEVLKVMAREENVGRATAKLVGGLALSFAGSRAGHAGAKHASNLVGGMQKAYNKVDNMVRYRS